eukprot:TRINITY_DN60367_c0_g1_i1.p1 TRINITY_DN60367_c0_g1~~TRINITY_DN60367_c0_g1_i1.p1  ORF type:complete len:359 (+),score=37.46 TRINITY_DN60367_c0_g1_i1:27-1103(+)
MTNWIVHCLAAVLLCNIYPCPPASGLTACHFRAAMVGTAMLTLAAGGCFGGIACVSYRSCRETGPRKSINPKVPVPLKITNEGNIRDVYDFGDWNLGDGSFGTVYTGRDKSANTTHVAIKVVKLSSEDGVAREIDNLMRLSHENIIQFVASFKDHRFIYIVEEIGLGGDLYGRVTEQDKGCFSERETLHCMREILKGVSYCNTNNTCIRGTKLEDIVTMTKGPIEREVLKLIDFDASCKLEPGTFMTTKLGTPYYVAPQVLAGLYDIQCDSWSCGVVMYICLCGYPPFFGQTDVEVLAKVRLGNYSFNAADWKAVTGEAKNLIRGLLKMNPKDRFTSSDALQYVDHTWAPAAMQATLS